ncbi:uncharacterized protein YALI1_B20709g [Yarrowia lipolytica]|uniref:Uncharacterized protein n=1 Tax=Yarrowia lipolytica TaxID=4952 RepID=A0A1D8N7Z2_YARLL|nr:hypothetical protein YALI1_B20709g [Yarrowia lipolytica]
MHRPHHSLISPRPMRHISCVGLVRGSVQYLQVHSTIHYVITVLPPSCMAHYLSRTPLTPHHSTDTIPCQHAYQSTVSTVPTMNFVNSDQHS